MGYEIWAVQVFEGVQQALNRSSPKIGLPGDERPYFPGNDFAKSYLSDTWMR